MVISGGSARLFVNFVYSEIIKEKITIAFYKMIKFKVIFHNIIRLIFLSVCIVAKVAVIL